MSGALRFSFAPLGLLGVFIEHERDPFAQVMRHRRACFVAQTFEAIQLFAIHVAGDQDFF
jgi:hypothetical protein